MSILTRFLKNFATSFRTSFLFTDADGSTRKSFDFSSGELDPEFTYTRNDSVATYRDSNGDLQIASANSPRFDHDTSGNFLGLRIEGEATNKCAAVNYNPTTTTGFTTGGDVNGVFSVVDDSAELAAAGLDQVCTNGNVYKLDNTLGSGSFYVEVDGTVGNTNPHSMSLYARGTGLNNTGSLFLGDDIVEIAPNGEGYALFKAENQTPSSTSRKMRILADNGDVLYFILFQLEEFEIATSIIAGNNETREQDVLNIVDIDTKEYFNASQGGVAAKMRFDLTTTSAVNQYPLVLDDGASTNTRGIRVNTDGQFRGWTRFASSSAHVQTNNDRAQTGKLYTVGFDWEEGISRIFSGPYMLNEQTTELAEPTTIDTFRVGSRNGSQDSIYGHVESLIIYSSRPTPLRIGLDFVRSDEFFTIIGGQSLGSGYFNSQESSSDAGKLQYLETLGSFITTPEILLFTNGATGGSALLKDSVDPDTRWWYDDNTGTIGESFQFWIDTANGCKNQISAIHWSQGEGDASSLANSTITKARYKATLITVIDLMREQVGEVPFIIDPIGRATNDRNGGFQIIREVQQELADELDYVYLSPEKFDNGLTDNVHLDDAGYLTQAVRIARKAASVLGETVTGGVDGPEISTFSRDSLDVTVTLSHDSGTDFTPTSNIQGFEYFISDTLISSTAVRTDSTTITLTLASAPIGVEVLKYGVDSLTGLSASQLVVDNATISLPLRANTGITLPDNLLLESGDYILLESGDRIQLG